ncbi:MAG: GAF domain-containing protein [bacterium]|nr:GAF domain-containing protein [bacterium]
MADSNHPPLSKADLERIIAERGEMFSRELVRSNDRFEDRIRELSVVRRVVDALKHIQDARKVFEGIIDTIIDETNAENCSLMLLDWETNGLVVKAARSQTDAATRYYGERDPEGHSFEKGEGIAGLVAERGEAISILDIAGDPRFVEATQATGPIRSLLCVPLLIDGEVIGVVNMSHPQPEAFTDEDRRLMVLIADQVAIALHSVQLFDHTLQINNVLETEVQKATEDLRRANEALQEEMAERKKTEQERIHTQRLRVAGELSAGISHNLNNILIGIMGPAQFLQRATDDPKLLREINDIYTSAIRARDLVHRLHLSTRSTQEDELRSVAVNTAVQEAVQKTSPRWKDEPEARGITNEVLTDLGDVPPIQGTESELSDIFINLIFNAVDAMSEGGTITISTKTVEEGVQIVVRDTGAGMDEETRRRVFEPFFTTKVDIGSGLGLSTVYGTVTRWRGTIEVESEPGKGTTFSIRFPAWIEEEVQEEEAVTVRQVRRAKLLIVEDNELVCEILDRLLSVNHEVEVALDGRGVLERFSPGYCDVALIDLGLPGMPGDQVAQQMQQVDPSVVTVLITGWNLDENDRRATLFDFRIQKPFDDLDKVMDVVAQAVELHDARFEKRK